MKFTSRTLIVSCLLSTLIQAEPAHAAAGLPQPPPTFIPIDHKGELPSSGITYRRNDGQTVDYYGEPNPAVCYYSWGGYPKVAAMRQNVVSLTLEDVDTIPTTLDSAWSLQFWPIGENANPEILPEAYEEVNEVHNFFLGHCPDGILNVPGYKRIVYKGIYPDIDMHLYSNAYGLKVYFVFNPGADPDDLLLQFSGQDSIRFDFTGSLRVFVANKFVRLPQALAYQEINGSTELISWGLDYDLSHSNGRVGFNFATYNPAYPLILDISASLGEAMTFGVPPEWGTYFGDARTDVVRNMIMLDNGEHLVCGRTTSPNFPVTAGAFQLDYAGSQDAFYSHFGTGYNRLYTTFYGGSGIDRFEQLCAATDQQSVYLVGTSRSMGIPTTSFSANCFQDASNEGQSLILARFPIIGPPIPQWQTYFGPRSIVPTGMVTDEAGNLYVGGYVQNFDGYTGETSCEGTDGSFPYCSFGASDYYQDFWGGGSSDAFLARFNAQLELLHSSLFGGAGLDAIYSMALDNDLQQLYFGGWTTSPRATYTNCLAPTNSGFPLCNPGSGFFQDDLNFNNTTTLNIGDGVLGSFNTGNGALSWATFVGSSSNEVAGEVVVDEEAHKLYVAGLTLATSFAGNTCTVPANAGFPECHGGYQYHGAIAGGVDLFLQKYDLATRTLEWSTITGGSEREEPQGLALTAEEDGTKTLVVGGLTWSGTMNSSSLPVQYDPRFYWQEEHADAASTDATHEDGFVYVFDEEQQRVLGTYFGGWGDDEVVAVGGYSTRLYLTGTALSTDDFPFNCPPTANPYCDLSYLNTLTGTSDVFHAQIQYDLTIGTEEIEISPEDLLILGPNPTSGELFIRLQKGALPTDLTIEVFDAAGRTYQIPELATRSGNESLWFDLDGLASGFFVVRLTSARAGLQVTRPLIVER